jgi:hypothetical protein
MLVAGILYTLPAVAGSQCEGPQSGEIKNSDFDFTFESWVKENSNNGAYRFERCVRNDHKRPVRIDWQSTGLNGVVDSDDAIYIGFDEETDEKVTRGRTLWYGPRPDSLVPSTVLRPQEAHAVPDSIPQATLVQFSNGVTLLKALQDPAALNTLINFTPDQQEIVIWSYARIGVPTRDGALDDLANTEKEIADTDFTSVNISLAEHLSLADSDKARSELKLRISVDEGEFARIRSVEGRIPEITITTNDEAIGSRLLAQQPRIELSAAEQVFSDQQPTLVGFPIKRARNQLTIDFGDNRARITLPFAYAN